MQLMYFMCCIVYKSNYAMIKEQTKNYIFDYHPSNHYHSVTYVNDNNMLHIITLVGVILIIM